MGDRALVIFHSPTTLDISPVTYLHWAGESVPDFIRSTRKVMRGRDGDVEYTAARFIAQAAIELDGNKDNLSLGVWNAPVREAQPLPKNASREERINAKRQAYELSLIDMRKKDFSHGDAGVLLVDISKPAWHVEVSHGYTVPFTVE